MIVKSAQLAFEDEEGSEKGNSGLWGVSRVEVGGGVGEGNGLLNQHLAAWVEGL